MCAGGSGVNPAFPNSTIDPQCQKNPYNHFHSFFPVPAFFILSLTDSSSSCSLQGIYITHIHSSLLILNQTIFFPLRACSVGTGSTLAIRIDLQMLLALTQ